MKSLFWWLSGICALCTTLWAQADQNNRFTVAMSIEMTTFSDPYTRDSAATSKTSLDGHYFALVTTKGSLASNQITSRLFVYSSEQIRNYLQEKPTQPPRAREIFALSKIPKALQDDSYGSLISDVQWSSDSQAILALVESDEGYRHLYRICVTCQEPPTDLTPGRSIDVQSFSESSGTIAYVVDTQVALDDPGPVGHPINSRATALTGTTLFGFLEPHDSPDRDNIGPPYELWVNHRGQRWKVMGDNGKYFPTGASSFLLALSPDGNFLITPQPVPEIPESWSLYKSSFTIIDTHASAFQIVDRSGRSPTWPWQYAIVDIEKKTSHPLVAAPSSFLSNNGDAFGAVWSKDQRRVIFTGSYLPIEEGASSGEMKFRDPCAAAVYDVGDKRASCVLFSHFPSEYLRTAEFGSSNTEARVGWLKDGKTRTELYRESGKTWSQSTEADDTKQADKLTLALRQEIDSPPVLWATDQATNSQRPLWNPNPQLKEILLGKARVYRWKDPSGYIWKGGLVLPPDYVSGRRYPLVIQTHGFPNEREFLADGSFTTGFAAQPLAAAGMIVLQVADRADRFTFPPTEEATLEVAGFKSAIEHLDADGLIDSDRVGIIGFSRTQWYVEKALIDCPQCFKAATVIDGLDLSYVSDVLFAPHRASFSIEREAANGGKPFGVGLEQWMKHAPGFNLDKIVTPLRVEAIGKMSVLGEWEIYSILTQQNKPVDLIYIPDGQHILQAPLDRYASQQGNVDWFRFWLNGVGTSANEEETTRWKAFLKPK